MLKYAVHMKKATLAEFDRAELDQRGTAERQVENLSNLDHLLPTPDELDELDPDEAIRQIEIAVENTRSFTMPSMAS